MFATKQQTVRVLLRTANPAATTTNVFTHPLILRSSVLSTISSSRNISTTPTRTISASSSLAVPRARGGGGGDDMSIFGGGGEYHHGGGSSGVPTYFSRSRLPANTIIRFVPQQQAWLVERMGKFHRILEPGLAILMPVIDKIQYVKSLKEMAIEIPSQSAITADNVTLELDGVLYIRIFDAYKASYGVEDAEYAISQLAQTTMRSEIGQLTLDQVLKERAALNTNITHVINDAAADWGVKILRYEIRDIHAPDSVLHAMHRQVSAERSKRAEILESEGQRQAAINIAEGRKQSVILASEAMKSEQINSAAGEAEAILLKARATAAGVEAVAHAIRENKEAAQGAVSLRVAEKYVEAFSKLAKESNTVVIPAQLGDLGGMISGAMSIYGKVSETQRREQQQLGRTLERLDEDAGSSSSSSNKTTSSGTSNYRVPQDEVAKTMLETFESTAGKK